MLYYNERVTMRINQNLIHDSFQYMKTKKYAGRQRDLNTKEEKKNNLSAFIRYCMEVVTRKQHPGSYHLWYREQMKDGKVYKQTPVLPDDWMITFRTGHPDSDDRTPKLCIVKDYNSSGFKYDIMKCAVGREYVPGGYRWYKDTDHLRSYNNMIIGWTDLP